MLDRRGTVFDSWPDLILIAEFWLFSDFLGIGGRGGLIGISMSKFRALDSGGSGSEVGMVCLFDFFFIFVFQKKFYLFA